MLPHDEDIQVELLNLLARAPGSRMHCQDVYAMLAQSFPNLTDNELTVPYRHSVSHWANRVQFARQHLIERGWLVAYSEDERSYWKISMAGRAELARLQTWATARLDELRALAAR